MIDMTPACRTTAGLLQALDESQLGNPTPCRDMDVAALLAHIGGLTLAFTAAAGSTGSIRLDAIYSAAHCPGFFKEVRRKMSSRNIRGELLQVSRRSCETFRTFTREV